MIRWARNHLTYGNVVATIALFVALGGGSYAALKVGSRQIANGSIRSIDIRNNQVRSGDVRNLTLRGLDFRRNSIGGGAIRERRLGPVRRAREADRLGGLTARELKLSCPPGTTPKSGTCIEGSARPATAFPTAVSECANAGRRLPDYAELKYWAQTDGPASAEGEWTSSVYRNADAPGPPSDQLEVVVVTPDSEGVAFRPALTPERLPYRCVALPSN